MGNACAGKHEVVGSQGGVVDATHLLSASSDGNVDVVRELLDSGVSVNLVNCDRRTALHVAASDGHVAVVQALLAQKADINPRDRWMHTPLDEANRIDARGVCNILLEAGAAPSSHLPCADEMGGSPTSMIDPGIAMCSAAAAGDLQLLQEMQSRGTDVNSLDYDGRTALTLAASHGHADVVRWLIEANADLNAKSDSGHVASGEALRHGHEEIVKMLQDAGAEAADLAEIKHHAKDEAWAIPLSELVIGKELSKTLKSVIYLATWRGTTVVCKSAGELHTNSSGRRLNRALTSMGLQKAQRQELTETQQELVREINLLSKMRHPDLVMFLGACVEHTPPLVLTEFMEGGDLERYYRRKAEELAHPFRPSMAKLLKWSSSVARALAFLHEATRPIIHRDLKPLNLLLTQTEELKVTDFGISKLMAARSDSAEDEDDEMKPQMSGGVGTWRYMAPEVVRYEQYTDRVDIYSYALILWFMSTGRQPFVEEFGTDAEVVLKEYVNGNEPRPRAAAMRCPSAFRELVEACWHVQAASRPSAVECTKRLATLMASNQENGLVDALKKHLHFK